MSLSCCRLPTCTYHLHLSVVYKSYIYAVRVLFRLARGSVCPVVLVYVAVLYIRSDTDLSDRRMSGLRAIAAVDACPMPPRRVTQSDCVRPATQSTPLRNPTSHRYIIVMFPRCSTSFSLHFPSPYPLAILNPTLQRPLTIHVHFLPPLDLNVHGRLR